MTDTYVFTAPWRISIRLLVHFERRNPMRVAGVSSPARLTSNQPCLVPTSGFLVPSGHHGSCARILTAYFMSSSCVGRKSWCQNSRRWCPLPRFLVPTKPRMRGAHFPRYGHHYGAHFPNFWCPLPGLLVPTTAVFSAHVGTTPQRGWLASPVGVQDRLASSQSQRPQMVRHRGRVHGVLLGWVTTPDKSFRHHFVRRKRRPDRFRQSLIRGLDRYRDKVPKRLDCNVGD